MKLLLAAAVWSFALGRFIKSPDGEPALPVIQAQAPVEPEEVRFQLPLRQGLPKWICYVDERRESGTILFHGDVVAQCRQMRQERRGRLPYQCQQFFYYEARRQADNGKSLCEQAPDS